MGNALCWVPHKEVCIENSELLGNIIILWMHNPNVVCQAPHHSPLSKVCAAPPCSKHRPSKQCPPNPTAHARASGSQASGLHGAAPRQTRQPGPHCFAWKPRPREFYSTASIPGGHSQWDMSEGDPLHWISDTIRGHDGRSQIALPSQGPSAVVPEGAGESS